MKNISVWILPITLTSTTLIAQPSNEVLIKSKTTFHSNIKKINLSLRKKLAEKRQIEFDRRDLLLLQRDINSKKRIRK